MKNVKDFSSKLLGTCITQALKWCILLLWEICHILMTLISKDLNRLLEFFAISSVMKHGTVSTIGRGGTSCNYDNLGIK